MMWITVVLICVLIKLIYSYITRNHRYWSDRKVKHDPPIPLFGNHLRNLMRKRTETEIAVELAQKYPNEKIIGYYRGVVPELVITDPDILKHIFVTDFLSFYGRGVGRDPKQEPLMMNLFSVDGDNWKLVRHMLSPGFTGSKLRGVFPLISRCASKLQAVAGAKAATGEDIGSWDLMARFTIEVIASVGFGIETDTMNTEHSNFLKLGEIIFSSTKTQLFLMALRELFPDIEFIQKFYVGKKEVQAAIYSIMNEIRRQRNHKPSGRNDFMDLLLELQAKGPISGKSIENTNPDGSPQDVQLEMDDECANAQLFVFFAAGYETSATATSFALHQLAYHPELQQRVQDEIDTVLSKYNNEMCYEAVKEMSLLEMTVLESLRMFPPAGATRRVCSKRYTIPNTNVTIDPGVRIIVPIQVIHMDKAHYDNPTEFRPERFKSENVRRRHHYSYLAFGEGPRKCIGIRLGMMQSIVGLAALLHKFKVEPGATSKKEYQIRRDMYLLQAIEGGLPIKLAPRNRDQ